MSLLVGNRCCWIIISHAGSLTVPLAKIEKDFETANPVIDILREAGGSTKMARMIAELGKPADIMASADYKVIDKALIPAMADWNIRFATNQLVLCCTNRHIRSISLVPDDHGDMVGHISFSPLVLSGHPSP